MYFGVLVEIRFLRRNCLRVVRGFVDNYIPPHHHYSRGSRQTFWIILLSFFRHGAGVFQTYLGVSKRKQNKSAVKLVFIV